MSPLVSSLRCLLLLSLATLPAIAADFHDVRLTTPDEDRQAGAWPVERLQSEVPEFRVVDDSTPIHSLIHEGESVQKPAIDALGDRRDAWVAAYDPGSHPAKCATPTLWVNGTHDKHYVLDSYAKSYSLVKGPRTLRIEPRMGHSHPAGWAPKEIDIFVDSILKDGVPLPEVGERSVTDGGTVRRRCPRRPS